MLAAGCVPAELSEVVVSRLTRASSAAGRPPFVPVPPSAAPPAAPVSASGVSQSVGAEPPSVAASSLPIF